jgi:hypothetical protein
LLFLFWSALSVSGTTGCAKSRQRGGTRHRSCCSWELGRWGAGGEDGGTKTSLSICWCLSKRQGNIEIGS